MEKSEIGNRKSEIGSLILVSSKQSIQNNKHKKAFTLIEIAIVLVIIGLIVGGVLVGQDLIQAAAIRAQISQIEKLNVAVNTFKGKYGYLPGDIPDPYASQFGFQARGTLPGQGDGNGLIETNEPSNGCTFVPSGHWLGLGETGMFWEDLTYANGMNLNMIEGSFKSNPTANPANYWGNNMPLFYPTAKIGGGNYIIVYAAYSYCGINYGNIGINYFEITNILALEGGGYNNDKVGLTVQQAYSIDKKADDGFPGSGSIQPVGGVNVAGTYTSQLTSTAPTPPSSTTCFDNGGVNGAAQQYSMSQNNGNGINCVLSFRFQ